MKFLVFVFFALGALSAFSQTEPNYESWVKKMEYSELKQEAQKRHQDWILQCHIKNAHVFASDFASFIISDFYSALNKMGLKESPYHKGFGLEVSEACKLAHKKMQISRRELELQRSRLAAMNTDEVSLKDFFSFSFDRRQKFFEAMRD